MKIKLIRDKKLQVRSGDVGVSFDDEELYREGEMLAQMLENRAFENADLTAFSSYPEGDGAELKISSDRPLFPQTPHYLRLSALSGGKGFKNRAFGGINLKAGIKYEFSFYARSYDFKGSLCVKIGNGGGSVEKKFKIKPDGKWHRFVYRKKAAKSLEDAEFILLLSAPGTVHLDWLSLKPMNAIKGLFRRDIFENLKDFKPGFLRFSGTVGFKDTLSEPQQRQYHPTEAGFYELLLYCELLCCRPLPTLKLNGADCELEDISDLVEFAVGSADSEWGSVRAEMGHPAAFPLEYLLLESEEGENAEFLDRYAEFLHEKFPKLKLVAPAKEGVGIYDHFYVREEVFYRSPEWFFENAHRYDEQPRGRRLLVSFAATERGALAEAAFMTGIEQNADLISAVCRLSLTGNKNYRGMDPLMKIDRKHCEDLPGLSVQKLFSLYTGNTLIKTEVEGAENVFASASEREGLTFVKIVNASDEKLVAEIEGDSEPGELNRIVLMQEDPVDSSVIPCEIAPSSAKSLTLPPHSFSVIIMRR